MFVDSDITASIDDVVKLIEHDKDIIGAPYLHHSKKKFNVWDLTSDGGLAVPIDGEGLCEVDGIGTGFLLIKREAFERIPEGPEWFYHPKVNGKVLCEDIHFCLCAKKAGLEVWCDFDITINHRLRKQSDFNWNLTKESNMGIPELDVPQSIDKSVIGISKIMNNVGTWYDNMATTTQFFMKKVLEQEETIKGLNEKIKKMETEKRPLKLVKKA